jgi:hypothetical protein
MRLIILLSVFLISFSASAQSYRDSIATGVTVRKDPRLDVLSAKQAEINKRSKVLAGNGFKRGYRIQVANTQNRDEANNVKAEMLRRFPDQKAYMLYQAPNFRVRIGNFSTQREAEGLKKMIALLYPNRGIYIVSDLIEYKILAEDDDL